MHGEIIYTRIKCMMFGVCGKCCGVCSWCGGRVLAVVVGCSGGVYGSVYGGGVCGDVCVMSVC